MRATTSCAIRLESLLYKEADGLALRYGQDHEQFAIEQLENDMNVVIDK